jgi:hypothetical protein
MLPTVSGRQMPAFALFCVISFPAQFPAEAR